MFPRQDQQVKSAIGILQRQGIQASAKKVLKSLSSLLLSYVVLKKKESITVNSSVIKKNVSFFANTAIFLKIV